MTETLVTGPTDPSLHDAAPATAPVAARSARTRADRIFPVTWPRLALEGSAVGAIAALFVSFLYRVWAVPLRLPLDDAYNDTLFHTAMVKTITERGWYVSNPRLGAPFGQRFYDFPHNGETFQLLVIRFMSLFTTSAQLTENVYYLGCYVVLAVVTFLVLRHLRFGFAIAAIVALVYSFLPYHLAHSEEHLWRSTYFTAPLGCLLLVWAQCWRSRFLIDPEPPASTRWRDNVRWPRVVAALAIGVLIGGTETMTTMFTAVLLGTAAIVAAIRWRDPWTVLVGGALAAAVLATFLVLSLPTLNYYRVHGTNPEAARRLLTDSELFGLKLSRLVTPQGGHRLPLLSRLGGRAQDQSRVRSEDGQALGILGTAGFLGALYGALARGIRGGRRHNLHAPDDREALADTASTVILLAVLFGTIGGFSIVLGLAGFSQVRAWNRIVTFIAFFSLLTVALWGERLERRLRNRWERRRPGLRRPALGGLAVAVLAFGLWDGLPARHRPERKVEAEWTSDQAFVNAIEAAMPANSAIFQLPVLAFPEVVAPGRMSDYDPLRGFLHDDGSLRWSYGAIKGRPDADWQVRLRDHFGPIGALPALLGMGFTGLWVDTYGYSNNRQDLAQIQAAITDPPLRSPDGRFLFYDLRPFRHRTGLTATQLRASAVQLLRVTPPR